MFTGLTVSIILLRTMRGSLPEFLEGLPAIMTFHQSINFLILVFMIFTGYPMITFPSVMVRFSNLPHSFYE